MVVACLAVALRISSKELFDGAWLATRSIVNVRCFPQRKALLPRIHRSPFPGCLAESPAVQALVAVLVRRRAPV